ncbi:MAG: hypothetical protein AMJ75_11290 [Phycisphaerae bacterium SM1_79]|nr:MAG: hypothetical protein AMJ75_11290 [Phycisphaerae bacterium SM1_79]
MSKQINQANAQQVLEQLSRAPSQRTSETAVVTSPGAGAIAWAAKVKSNYSYNFYNVVTVVVSSPGTEPYEIGQQTQAANLAEPFDQQGTLAAGTYVVMFRVGNKNIFYAPA